MHATPARTLLDEILRTTVVLSLALVALVPAVRETQTALGWLPLWLVGMPAIALWAVRALLPQPMPERSRLSVARPVALRRPSDSSLQRQPQARRRARRAVRMHAIERPAHLGG